MKWTFGLGDVWSRASVAVVAGFAIFVLAENGCSDPGNGSLVAGGDAGACRPGETLEQIGQGSFCCTGTSPNLVCYQGARPGDPCSASTGSLSAEQVNVKLDTCVNDACNGDRTPTSYDAQAIATTTPLACENGKLATTGDSTTHEVDRVCADVAPLLCTSSAYAYGYGYTTTYGYGYYGGSELMKRAVSVTSSVCSTNNGAPLPCDVGDL